MGLSTEPGKLTIQFSDKINQSAAEDVSNYAIKVWSLKRSANYGSKHYDEHPLKVTGATLAADGRTVTLTIPDIAPTWCMEIRCRIETPDGQSVERVIHNSIHHIADELKLQPKKSRRMVFLTNGPDPFWETCRAGAEAATKQLRFKEEDILFDFRFGDFTDRAQVELLTDLLTDDDIAGVAISVFNPDSRKLISAMRELSAKGVPVITVDGDVDLPTARDARFGYIGTDQVMLGKELGKAAKVLRPDGAKMAFFVGRKSVPNAAERISGFHQGAGTGGNLTEVTTQNDGGDRVKARENVERALDRHPECNLLVGVWGLQHAADCQSRTRTWSHGRRNDHRL